MSISKIINVNDGSGRVFEENTIAELQFDVKPEVGSFNAVTSDAVARAVAGASGEVPQVTENDNGKVLTASYDAGGPSVSWEDTQGAEYTAGEGIAISDENVISCTVQGPSAGAGINITDNTVSVNHDSTLTEVGGEQQTPLSAATSVARGPTSKGKRWATNAVEVDLSNLETNETDHPILRVHLLDFYGESYSLNFDVPVEGFDLPLYPCITLVKPDDSTKYRSYRVMDVEVYTQGGMWVLPVATIVAALDSNPTFSDGSTSSYTDLLVDGKALLYITLSTPGKGGATPVTGTDADPSDVWARFVGPAYNGANMLAAQLGVAYGSDTVPPAIDWDSYVESVTGQGTAQLSVADPVPSVDGHTGEFLKAGSNGPEWDTVDGVPSYSSSDDGKVLGVVDNAGSASLQWVEGVPSTAGVPNSSVLAMGNSGMEWVAGGVTSYLNITSGTASIGRDNTVVTSTADITSIIVGANVKSAVVQWKVNSTTTLPTVTSGGSPLGASVNNPSSLTVGHVVQVSILNGTWVCAEFTDPNNPLGLPSHTIRCKFNAGYTPTQGNTQTLVDAGENIWDIYKSTDSWENFFSSCSDLLEVVGANTTGVTATRNMFMNCSNLTAVPLFDTSSVENISQMFYGCSSIASVPQFVTSSATTMQGMFNDCSNLTSVPLFDTSSVTNMYNVFNGCSSLTSVPLFDTSSATDMHQMFMSCTSLTSVPLFDTSSVTNMESMFQLCSNLKSVPLFNTSSATNMGTMFNYCTNVESGALALYQQASSQATPPSNHDGCFSNCGSNTVTGAAELAQIPASWGGSGT